MTVTAQTPYNVSTANGVTTVFAYGFRILSEADIVVKVDGVTKTLTTDYTVTGVGAANGGTVVFGVAPANDAEVLRQRSVSLTRAYDYQQSGDLLAETLNEDIDRIWMAMQGIDTDVGLSFRLPVTVSGWDTEIPEPTADYALFANAAGTGFEWREAGSVDMATPGDQTVTVAKMSASQTNVLFGRSTAGAGAGEEIPVTDATIALLATAGSTPAEVIRSLLPAGSVIGSTYAEQAAYVAVTATTVSDDDNAPQNTQGTEIITASITPSSATSKIRIRADMQVDSADTYAMVGAVYKNTDAPALAAKRIQTTGGSTDSCEMALVYEDSPATTSAITYKIRLGRSGGGNAGVNGVNGSRKLGGAMRATLVLEEIKV